MKDIAPMQLRSGSTGFITSTRTRCLCLSDSATRVLWEKLMIDFAYEHNVAAMGDCEIVSESWA